MPTAEVPMPPREIFKHGLTKTSQVSREDRPLYGVIRAEYPPEGGIYIYKAGGDFEYLPDGRLGLRNPVDLLYPEKGFPYPDAIRDNNIAKRLLVCFAEFFTSKPLTPFLVLFLLLPLRFKLRVIERWIKWYTRSAELALLPHILDDIRYTTCARGLRTGIYAFMEAVGINKHWCHHFSMVFATLIEYDDSYRFRVEDLASETNRVLLLDNPRKEINRLAEILKKREPNLHTSEKFLRIAKLLSYVLVFPRIKKAFKIAVEATDFSLIQMDKADRYHTLKFGGYDFGGRTAEDRWAEYEKLHKGVIPKPLRIGVFEKAK